MVIEADKRQLKSEKRRTRNGAALMFGVTLGALVFDEPALILVAIGLNATIWILYVMMLSAELREMHGIVDEDDL